ncbi:MAG: T9SS type A sorting domain-containing protein [candidate division Zixibacteria bacterium]|nr:T9SS type A sorting domain-containing protein [candidate division Zixibacteria bacterium]
MKYLLISLSIILMAAPNYIFANDLFTFTSEALMQAVPTDSEAIFEAVLKNTGERAETYSIVKSNAIPVNWSSLICIDTLCTNDSGSVSLAPGESAVINPEIHLEGFPGQGEITITAFPLSHPSSSKSLTFRAAGGYPTLLINAGDEQDEYRVVYENSLTAAGRSFNYWDLNFSRITLGDLINFNNLVIFSGDRHDSLFTSDEVEALFEYLNGDHNLMITGQGVTSGIHDRDFLNSVLGLDYVRTYTGGLEVLGVESDPISGGFEFNIYGGDGADNQTKPDKIESVNSSVPFMYYISGDLAGVYFKPGESKRITMAFGFEAIDNEPDRTQLMTNIFNWFDDATNIGDGETELPATVQILKNYPNPFNSTTIIEVLNPPESMDKARIEIFDIAGRKVTDIPLNGGTSAKWDGTNNANSPVSTGIYFYRLTSPYINSDFNRMVLIK